MRTPLRMCAHGRAAAFLSLTPSPRSLMRLTKAFRAGAHPDLGCGQQVPRIGGQHEEYLQESLRGFHSGSRPGYTQAMTEAVSQIPPEDLDTLAYYVARFGGPAGALTGK